MQLSPFRPASLFAALAVSTTLLACGGHSPLPGEGGDAGQDAGLTGAPCNFDPDCAPPNYICDTATNTCTAGCTLNNNCPSDRTCNTATGRCIAGQPQDGGADAGPDAGVTGVPSPTLCETCAGDSDCKGSGRCVANPAHNGYFCTQDCTDAPCPTGYACTIDRTGTQHQCYPSNGFCQGITGSPDGGVGTPDGGPVNDPNVPSVNPNGCGFCGQCVVNNDCSTNSVCINGTCAIGPCSGWSDCALHGGIVAKCSDVGLAQHYCVPYLGQCLPLPGVLGGDKGCKPTQTGQGCGTPTIPGTSDGANVAVTQNLSPKPQLATEDSLTRDSQGRLAIGYLGVDGNGSYVGVSQSADDGQTWVKNGRMSSTTPAQTDPVLVTSKWNDGTAHERMHYAWVGFTPQTSTATQPTFMYVETAFSDDGGATWSQPSRVTTDADTGGGSLLVDKPWLAVSPDASQTLLASVAIGNNSQQHVFTSISADHGQTWQPKNQVENGETGKGHSLAMPIFDPTDASGNTAYLVYLTYGQLNAGTVNSVVLVKSTDRGAHWSAPITVSAADDQVLFEPPSIAVDASHHLYIGYVGSPAGTSASLWDALVATVDISGSPVLSHRVRASDDQAACFQHIHSLVQVDRATGHVFAGWLDNRQGGLGGTWYSVSTDGGATFGPSHLVSDTAYAFNPDRTNAQREYLGDYFGFLFDGTRLRFAWSDPRNGSDSQVFYVGGAP
jgi:hypothetical protein